MLRQLFTLRWLSGLVLALAGAAVMLRLGRWQLSRGETTHSLQNYAYAVEWVLFAAFTIFCFYRLARDAGRSPDELEPRSGPEPVVLAPTSAPVVADDPELAAYNAYLARLNERA